eukprot:Gregarina_sp_Poly_1__152@NODE_1033_length_5290_cov_286_769864_g717_i0_p5_GENE_NODE_1033_length_5290_cov_286_769864_g717_i0NODE_1033_length_5290_cov_286_769864_g717_i0_p5_ORF_typecomplete_len109_score4_26DHHC/PF01529_20/0_0017_NODE_1033_length_5290_cov_286_769864_g717_i026282954
MSICTSVEFIRLYYWDTSISWGHLYVVMLLLFLSGFSWSISAPFYAFHLWLASKNMSTIEFCESDTGQSRYDAGNMWLNLAEVYGLNPFLWFVPFGMPGDPRGGLFWD